MPQSLVIQVGQCGNQIGRRFWERALLEHSAHNPHGLYNDPLATFFRNVKSSGRKRSTIGVGDGTGEIHGLEARGIMVDMEEGVLGAFLRDTSSPMAELFVSPHQTITSSSGSGNNWAVGHHHYGPQYRDVIADAVRKEAEQCDALQSVFLLHSLGGGTGSGLGTYISSLLADELPDAYQFATVVAPAPNADDVVTSPYNTVLALAQLTEHADAVLPIDNQALLDVCARAGRSRSRPAATDGASTAVADPAAAEQRPFDAMNDVVAQLMLHLTSSMRFEGSLNVDINEITMNLVPFPKLKYLLSSLVPTGPSNSSRGLGSLPPAAHHSAGRTTATPPPSLHRANTTSAHHIDAMFTEAFTKDAHLVKCDPRQSTYLACAVMVRGSGVQVTDIRRNIDRIQSGLKFAWWNTEGWKTGLCSVPPQGGAPHALLALSNNCSIGESFAGVKTRFMKLYSRKANVHHYLEHMDRSEFSTALASITDLIGEYRRIDSDPGPAVDDWEQWAHEQAARFVGANG
ncbi:Tubulin/FtsZ, GTPase domain-containing protein [Blastocladiella britannica]|nr:Tubulin/FtsZ, GTPase domain-containing protein [Blastocladiella britannica]